MKEINFPTHISDNVQEAALQLLRDACRMFRKGSLFDYIYEGLTPWEISQLCDYMEELEHNLETKEKP